ncbi:hypothetical protein ACIQXF_06570 [Lysinibacillus sp. NPDC097231]|uniref:hypothetical protein n=1 Tax=Lysinibacillus sp. NPDC097231 TaxID=3364142 RepID=UPI00381251F5
MVRNGIRESEKVKTQTDIVRKQFVENGIDLALVGAGQTLFASLEHARKRVKTDKSYIAKGIKYRLNLVDRKGKQTRLKPRYTLVKVIQGDNEFWQAWIKQNEVFEKTGLEADRPSLHRLNPDGHYEFGNIGVLPLGEHLQENAVPMLIMDTDNLTISSYESITAMMEAEGVKKSKVDALRVAMKKANA